MKSKFLLLFTNVFFVRGYTRTMVLDIQKEKWIFIDNEYYEIILQLKTKSIESVTESFDANSIVYFNEFVNFILDNDYGAIVDDINLFPEIREYWDSPYQIDNAILDLDKQSSYEISSIADQLQKLNCQFIEIRYFGLFDIEKLNTVLSHFEGKDLRFIHVITEYGNFEQEEYFKLCTKYINVGFTLYNSPVNKLVKSSLNNIVSGMGHINYIQQKIDNCSFCGIINETTLIKPKDVTDFMENKLFNSCLNRKISIDTDGNIKNCPSMKKSFGNILDESLIKVSENIDFQKKWSINKDLVEVCKDCEYRYVCSDCRAYTKNPSNEYSKPLKCFYDPYTGVWEDMFSVNPTNI